MQTTGYLTRVSRRRSWTIEKRKALDHRRQAKDESAERLFFNLLAGLAFVLEPIAPAAGQPKSGRRLIIGDKQKRTHLFRRVRFLLIMGEYQWVGKMIK
ncbi:hypothetical protein [Bacillus sp. REN10]|uniref:hypothetical protein n=1 Tax=Bacillus sp. REN10 TaxID=2782541 RepID=UPI00193C6000|nr:hypothetical protein [Bacillus sp. REN10]